LDCRVNFQIVIYPGPLGIPDKISADAPPAFFLVSNDDRGHVEPVMRLVQKYREANRPVELHLYAHGGHGFNLGGRSKLASIKTWPQRMADWLADSGFLSDASATPAAK
jgi:acetyl esterase/lipase